MFISLIYSPISWPLQPTSARPFLASISNLVFGLFVRVAWYTFIMPLMVHAPISYSLWLRLSFNYDFGRGDEDFERERDILITVSLYTYSLAINCYQKEKKSSCCCAKQLIGKELNIAMMVLNFQIEFWTCREWGAVNVYKCLHNRRLQFGSAQWRLFCGLGWFSIISSSSSLSLRTQHWCLQILYFRTHSS